MEKMIKNFSKIISHTSHKVQKDRLWQINFIESFWNNFQYGSNLAFALIARNISRVNCSKLAKMEIFKPP